MSSSLSDTSPVLSDRVRRLIYQASYTGMKETDLLLGHFAKSYLDDLSDDDLKKLHEVSLNKNVPWKCQHIAQLQFRQNIDNAGVLTSRAKACKDALNSAMEVYFAKVYWKDGSYDHKAFTDDILEAIKDKAGEAGEARGVAKGKGKGKDVPM